MAATRVSDLDIVVLSHKINEVFGSKSHSMVWYNQCLVFKEFIDSTVRDLQLHWSRQYAEETEIVKECDVESRLLCVLGRGLELIQQCAEPESMSSSEALIILLGSAGEFCDIVDDVKGYCQMQNNVIMRVLKFGPIQHSAKEQLMERLQDKIKSDCFKVKEKLISFYEQDKNALIDNAGITSSGCLSRLIPTLKTGVASSIADSDLSEKEKLGSGSFGTVYKAQWCQVIPVAIKEFNYDQYFEDEYELFKKLPMRESSHIIQILGHYKNESNKRCLVMELMDMDLKRLIEINIRNCGGSPFSIVESIDIMIQVAKGMRSLHAVDVIHRDLKPANILVKSRQEGSLIVKLADFGASKADFQTLVAEHTVMRGTVMYMAPEMEMESFQGTASYTRKVDVYSFGILCTEILTGRIDRVMKQNLKNGQMLSLPPDIPHDLCQMIYSCLESMPQQRPSFEEIVGELWVAKERVLISESKIDKYIDCKMQLTSLGGEVGIHVIPQTPTPTLKKIVCYFSADEYIGELKNLPTNATIDIQFYCLHVKPNGHICVYEHLLETIVQLKRFIDAGKKLNLSFVVGRFEWLNPHYLYDAFSTCETRKTFVNSVLELCRAHPFFHGLFIDLDEDDDDERCHDTIGQDGINFCFVIQQLRTALPSHFTIAVGVCVDPKKFKWPVDMAIQLIDQIHLYSHRVIEMDNFVKYYINRGVPSSKIILTEDFYGYKFNDDFFYVKNKAEYIKANNLGGIRMTYRKFLRCSTVKDYCQ